MIFDQSPQGSPEWLAMRRGICTASRFKDARDKLKGGAPSKTCIAYAMDLARERVGGTVPPLFQNAAMKTGTEQEPIARVMYEAETGELLQEVGFAYTEDRKFGVSVDSLIGTDGVWECKTMVSSATLFTAMVEGDITSYIDQCNGAMWLLGRKWCDLTLWCPDLQLMHTVRIARNDDAIEALEADLIAFERVVTQYETALRAKLAPATTAPQAEPTAPTTPAPAARATRALAEPTF